MAIPNETIQDRFSCVAHIGGRMFYGINNNVYYSQIMEGNTIGAIAKCYQKNDPTAEQLSDLLDTDGGSIPINNAHKIIQLKRYKNGVLVFADNGVWYIAGPDSGFKATSFFVRDITETGCISPDSVVAVEGAVFFWSDEGIFTIQDNEFGIPQATNITEQSIQSLYSAISKTAKSKSTGVYNRVKKQIEWFYPSSNQDGATDYYSAKDKSLLYDLRSQGFFPQSYESRMTEGNGVFLVGGFRTSLTTEDTAVQYLGIETTLNGSTYDYKISVHQKNNTGFQDLGTAATSAGTFDTAYFESGYESLGKPSNSKSAPYIMTHFTQTEQNFVDDGSGGLTFDLPSSCLIQSKWDWNNSSANGRWGPPQEAYRFRRPFIPSAAGAFDSGEEIISTKSKVLGRGKSLSVRFEQTPLKDFQLQGYTIQWSMKGRI